MCKQVEQKDIHENLMHNSHFFLPVNSMQQFVSYMMDLEHTPDVYYFKYGIYTSKYTIRFYDMLKQIHEEAKDRMNNHLESFETHFHSIKFEEFFTLPLLEVPIMRLCQVQFIQVIHGLTFVFPGCDPNEYIQLVCLLLYRASILILNKHSTKRLNDDRFRSIIQNGEFNIHAVAKPIFLVYVESLFRDFFKNIYQYYALGKLNKPVIITDQTILLDELRRKILDLEDAEKKFKKIYLKHRVTPGIKRCYMAETHVTIDVSVEINLVYIHPQLVEDELLMTETIRYSLALEYFGYDISEITYCLLKNAWIFKDLEFPNLLDAYIYKNL